MQFLQSWLGSRSLYRQFSAVFRLIACFVVLAAVPALVLTELSSGSGGAINVSGSLRMQSYKLTFVVSNPYSTALERRRNTLEAVAELEKRLSSPDLIKDVPKEADDPVRERYRNLLETFEKDMKPLALESIESESARRLFMGRIVAFVDDVDVFVRALEENLTRRLSLLKVLLSVTLLGAVVVTYVMLRTLRRRIFAPLTELEDAVDGVRRGDFSVRLQGLEENEIGRLGRGFNFMVKELERLYGSLEAEVAKKTADLDRRNQGLEFLHRTSERLQLGDDDLKRVAVEVLEDAIAFSGARAGAVLLHSGSGENAYEFARTEGWNEEAQRSDYVLELPVVGRHDACFGALKVCFERPCPEWKRNVLALVAGTLGRALAAERRASGERRLAVLEERSTIARELHDSIAQSLSFARIQLLRLKLGLERDAPKEETMSILAELQEGVGTAYRQLRQVLTAFRLQISGDGLDGALRSAVDEFASRTGIETVLDNTLPDYESTANDQVHLVHILREALANVEKHAKAAHVAVRIEPLGEGGFRLEVCDDGIGIPEHAEKDMHFGLSIMRERAQALKADIRIERRTEGGTRVLVERSGERDDR